MFSLGLKLRINHSPIPGASLLIHTDISQRDKMIGDRASSATNLSEPQILCFNRAWRAPHLAAFRPVTSRGVAVHLGVVLCCSLRAPHRHVRLGR